MEIKIIKVEEDAKIKNSKDKEAPTKEEPEEDI